MIEKNNEKKFIFIEPHPTGGNATVEITERQIVNYMRKQPKYVDASQAVCIQDFCIVRYASEKQ